MTRIQVKERIVGNVYEAREGLSNMISLYKMVLVYREDFCYRILKYYIARGRKRMIKRGTSPRSYATLREVMASSFFGTYRSLRAHDYYLFTKKMQEHNVKSPLK